MHLPEGSSFTPPPAGAHRAVCVSFIDLGTQKVEYKGEVQHKRLIRIRWELVDEKMDDGRPYTISKRYTWSMFDKASLRKDLESWRGKPFEKTDFGKTGFDTKKLLGVPCLLNVVHKESGGNVYANITGISPLPKSMPKPDKYENLLVYIALDHEWTDADRDAFETLTDKMKEQIRQSPEYREFVQGIAPTTDAPDRFRNDDLDDEIPF